MKANNKLISHQKHELELNAIDIRSSLHSASQFQAALTPREADINDHFKNANYIYYPLDIVSGDLPLCFSNETHTWLAAIDCIGHGVPAAMLTFTAHYTLKDIIQRNPLMSPSEVLEKLHRTIILSFDNKDEDAKFHSGMDISLVCVCKTKNTLDFAGAMSPMIIQAKDGSCQVIRGVRRSVADFSTPVDQKFTTHTFKLDEIQRFVLFSDGFIHQLNEQTQKIFSLARLLKIVQEQSNKTTRQLKESLIKEHKEWKGKYSQTDDILLLVVEN
jgi:serine phosphatase RsbU (regulator of sigma subunit)